MKLNKLLRDVIVENRRINFLYDKNVKGESGNKPLLDFDTFKILVNADPTTRLPEGVNINDITEKDIDKISAGSYSQWLIKNYVNIPLSDNEREYDFNSPEYKKSVKRARNLFIEDLYKVTSDLRKFENAKPYLPTNQRDINKFNPKELFLLLRDFEIPKKKKDKETEKEIKQSRKGFEHKGGVIDFSGDKWTVIKIEGTGEEQKDAACYFGGFHEYDKGETRWCTSSPGLGWWKNYLDKGPLYVIFPNDSSEVSSVTNLPKERYQFHFQKNHYMDRHDNPINLEKFLNSNPELKDYFEPEFAKNLMWGKSKSVKITYPSDSNSMYVEIYGIESLFKKIPKDIYQFMFVNKSKDKILFDIPDSINEYNELTSIVVDNCLRNVSKNIGECKNLEFIAFTNNTELTKLPGSILDLPNLKIISLVGSNNVVLPQNFEDKFYADNSLGFYSSIDNN